VRVHALGRVPFLAGLDHEALHRVDARCGMRGIEAGEALYLAGHQAERLYVVATGALKLTGASPDGTEVLLDVLGPGAYLGTLPALGGATYAEDAWALTAGCLLSFTAAEFDAVLDEHPAVGRDALAATGARLRATQARVERLAAASASVRVASTLLVLAEQLGVHEDGRILIDVPLAREDLASLAGCAAETVSRSLARWRREGTIDTGRRWVALRRPDALAVEAGVATELTVRPRRRGGPAGAASR
jgi:CRP/FNR family transcriptional regulator, nitrogen oxide reductase regulator